MRIIDLYGPFIKAFDKIKRSSVSEALKTDSRLAAFGTMAREWGQDFDNVTRWMASPEYGPQRELAVRFAKDAPALVKKIESIFAVALEGELRLSPSLMRFDGFARYELGTHTVWFGVDHPDASDSYLRALLAHELSHVYRDHRPAVWAHLGKPLNKVTRDEYLDATTAREHLASEGLATLFSQIAFPEVPLHLHHYYLHQEMEWCLNNFEAIDHAIRTCLKGDQDVWSFYGEGIIQEGSPSRTQYFWAAKILAQWLPQKIPGKSFKDAVIEAHGWPAEKFECFAP